MRSARTGRPPGPPARWRRRGRSTSGSAPPGGPRRARRAPPRIRVGAPGPTPRPGRRSRWTRPRPRPTRRGTAPPVHRPRAGLLRPSGHPPAKGRRRAPALAPPPPPGVAMDRLPAGAGQRSAGRHRPPAGAPPGATAGRPANRGSRRGRAEEGRPGPGPPPRRPGRELDDVGRRAHPRHLGDGLEGHAGRGDAGDLDHPASNAAAVEVDPDDRADVDAGRHGLGNGVVEGLPYRRNVRQHANDQRPR